MIHSTFRGVGRSSAAAVVAAALFAFASQASAQQAPAAGAPRPLVPAEAAQAAPVPAGVEGAAADGAADSPLGFVDEMIIAGWNQAIGVTFAAGGRAFVWEKAGRVWIVDNGVKKATPFLDISPEVGNWEDFGLLSFALDPHFATNGFVYAFYVVDHHYLAKFGTPEYDAGVSEPYVDTIARITRFTANPSTNFETVLSNSRLVLLGESASTGLAITGFTHGPGTLVFGDDGTLMVSCGDGVNGASSGTALGEGILKPKENVGPFRAQLLDCLGGKVLRLDPATGNGVPSNPFFDPSDPRAPRSRVFDLGLRNPYRMTLRPGTGNPNPAAADPGSVYLGDVGAESYEELDVAATGGLNFGWPVREGLHPSVAGTVPTANLDAPNPLFGTAGCNRPTFDFQDLIVEDTLNVPSWPNPCSPGQQIVTPVPLFVHHRPVLEWAHGHGAFVPIFDAGGFAQFVPLEDQLSPVAGTDFGGNCSTGGCWYEGRVFPPMYQDTYFHGDFGGGWIRNLVFDASDKLVEVRTFADAVGRIVCLAVNPAEGSLWYLNYTETGTSQLRRIRYVSGNLSPVAALTCSATSGTAPLSVTFNASGSVDPEGQPLQVTWDFGDGTPLSHQMVVSHVFPSEDISLASIFTGEVFKFTPPGSTGFSNHDVEVMRDGDLPPLGSVDMQRQYDTIHKNDHGLSDKGPIDSIGYRFVGLRTVRGILYQEGMTFPGGGFFSTVGVEALQGGVWVPVSGVVFTPAYPGDLFPHYETFEISFPPVLCRGIRLFGPDGGISSTKFVTIGELRVVADPAPQITTPEVYTVTLTVSDPAGASTQLTRDITINDAPPVASIVRPDEFFTFDPAQPSLLNVGGVPSDPDQASNLLTCTWQSIHHHNDHTHPGEVQSGCTTEIALAGEGCDGDPHWLELVYTVKDPFGLTATASRHLVPICDRDLDGVQDSVAIALGQVADTNHDGIPDVAQTDCDNNGRPDLYEIFFATGVDADHDGILDACEP